MATTAIQLLDNSSKTQQTYSVTIFSYWIETLLTNCPKEVSNWISRVNSIYKEKQDVIVGVHVEWYQSEKGRDVAVLSLCVGGLCLIFQVMHATDRIPNSLYDFFRNDRYTFAGIEIKAEALKLWNRYRLDIKVCETLPASKTSGLKDLAKDVLGKDIEKPKAIRASNWHNKKLKEDQIKYACIDAFLSFEIALRLALDV